MQKLLHTILLLSALTIPPLPSVRADEDHGHNHDDEHGHDSHEEEAEHVSVSPETLERYGVTIEKVGPASLAITLDIPGRLLPNEDRIAHITPRFPGIIREVRKRLGDPIEKGEVVAVVESNQNLQNYEVRALLGGIVTERHASLGEFVTGEAAILEVSDYSELFADFFIFPQDFPKVRLGQRIQVLPEGKNDAIEATLSFLSPVVDPTTQSRFARAVLRNEDRRLQPGAFVTGKLLIGESHVPVAVVSSAVQVDKGASVVFVREHERFEARPIVIGRRNSEWTEVLSGIEVGEAYASGNTFILKAELGKGEAEHEH
jgi:cobalt-zinc-cadmium efflux system membrane fusion protein